ncbi:hypothetical protein HYS48_04305 [Candidatus Woesearchaeota archaeon]|nr:hypothetical protein [Candidatus Woesearchaeota archaeon]
MDDRTTKWILGLLIAALVLLAYNSFQLNAMKKIPANSLTNSVQKGGESSLGLDVIPKGIPEIYGNELGIAYDMVNPANLKLADAAIRKLAVFDQQITLEGADKERYIKITSQISCEYCCGAESIIFPNGEAACGCAHSFAMRGLAKYLIKYHPTEFTDDEILEELGKWKTLFFPGKLTQKAQALQGKGLELNYINLASNKYRGIEQGAAAAAGGGMVGGC